MRDRQTDRDRDRQTETETETEKHRQTGKNIQTLFLYRCTQIKIPTVKPTDR